MDTPEKTKEKDIVSWVGFVLLKIGRASCRERV